VEWRSYVKTAVLCHRNAQEYHAELQEAVGDHILPYESVARWIQAFRIGEVSTADMSQWMFYACLHVRGQN
jgi:hypothetical protein